MKIAIIGAGFTGLTAAYRLSQKDHIVTVFEKEKIAGGLAAGFKEKNWDWSLEYFFHHLFPTDLATQNLILELGLSDKLFWAQPKSSIFYQGKISRFDSPYSLFRFPFLSLPEKLRTGLATFYLQSTNNWQSFENITAFEWLKKYYGNKPFEILWKPLLLAKFGNQAKNISMAWFWARIKKRSSKLGYLEGGFQNLIDKLIEKIKSQGGRILLNRKIKNLNDIYYYSDFDRVLITTSIQMFFKKTKLLKMLGALNLIFVLKEKFLTDGTYWLNINESGFPFVAVVEHTNFVDPFHYGGNHLLYVGGYYPQNHHYFKITKEQIFEEFLPYLQKINPQFNMSHVTCHMSHANRFAQPIIPINYSKLIPPHQTSIPGVYLANIQQVYPWDRGINYAIELGEKIADEIQNS